MKSACVNDLDIVNGMNDVNGVGIFSQYCSNEFSD